MFHLKGSRIGLPAVKRFGILNSTHSHPLKLNRHTGPEIHFVLKGEITWVLDKNPKPLRLPGGSFGIIPANTAHRALGDNGEPAKRVGVIFEAGTAHLTDNTPFSSDDFTRILSRFADRGGHVHRLSPRLVAILNRLISLMNLETVSTSDGQLHLRLLVVELIHETYLALDEPEVLSQGRDVIPKICQWIDEHLSERIAVSELIKLSGYGRSRFFTLFLGYTGLTPNDYILRSRIRRAKHELGSRRFKGSILELALACGFNSSAAFSKVFRRQVGLSPREFRTKRNT